MSPTRGQLIVLVLGGLLAGWAIRTFAEARLAVEQGRRHELEQRLDRLEWQVEDCRERVIRCCTP